MKFISEKITIGEQEFILRIPDPMETEQRYNQAKEKNPQEPFPYWTRLWPSAIALSTFIIRNPGLVRHKKVLEMGAGLGLPSIVSSRFAAGVIWSDYLQQALDWMKESIRLEKIVNIECRLLDFFSVPPETDADLLLLSDINYDPSVFQHVIRLINQFLDNNRIVLLTTPQRLTAAYFIDQIQTHIVQQEDIVISFDGKQTLITLFVLKSHNNTHKTDRS